MFKNIRKALSSKRDAAVHAKLENFFKEMPVPFFWLFGKTQSGKTSIIKFLTGADQAEIGQGFRPCTRFSREYQFPTAEAPLMNFLDTRGLEEPGYDPSEDLQQFNAKAHVIIVTVRVLDHALDDLRKHLRVIRDSQPQRPVVLALTCLHEAYPQQQHREPYPFSSNGDTPNVEGIESVPEELTRSIARQSEQFAGLVAHVVPIDLTPPEEGFNDPHYGGEQLKQVLIQALPAAYRQTLIQLEKATSTLQDLYAQHALPHILGFSSLAATAGAIPIPWVDLFILPGIQTQMIYHLAQFYGQPLSAQRFTEFASTVGLGMLVRQGIREVVKFIPFVGSLAGAALAGSATFALGKAFCYYYSAVHQGQVPKADDLKHYYKEQLALAEKLWQKR